MVDMADSKVVDKEADKEADKVVDKVVDTLAYTALDMELEEASCMAIDSMDHAD